MANVHRGEVGFTSKGEPYKLSFSANALVEIEVVLGRDVDELIAEMRAGKVKLVDLRLLFWQGLLDNLPELKLDEAKIILSGLRPHQLGRLVGEAFMASLPDAEVADAGNSNPPQPGTPEGGAGPAS